MYSSLYKQFTWSFSHSVLESDILKVPFCTACPTLKSLHFLWSLCKPHIAFWMSHRSPKCDGSKNWALHSLFQMKSFPHIPYTSEGNLLSPWIQAKSQVIFPGSSLSLILPHHWIIKSSQFYFLDIWNQVSCSSPSTILVQPQYLWSSTNL